MEWSGFRSLRFLTSNTSFLFAFRQMKPLWSLTNLIGQLHLRRSSWSTGLFLYDLMIYSKSIKFVIYLLSNPLVLTFSFIAEIIFSQGFRLGEYGHIVAKHIFCIFEYFSTSVLTCSEALSRIIQYFSVRSLKVFDLVSMRFSKNQIKDFELFVPFVPAIP